jgi:hypothetical protein
MKQAMCLWGAYSHAANSGQAAAASIAGAGGDGGDGASRPRPPGWPPAPAPPPPAPLRPGSAELVGSIHDELLFEVDDDPVRAGRKGGLHTHKGQAGVEGAGGRGRAHGWRGTAAGLGNEGGWRGASRPACLGDVGTAPRTAWARACLVGERAAAKASQVHAGGAGGGARPGGCGALRHVRRRGARGAAGGQRGGGPQLGPHAGARGRAHRDQAGAGRDEGTASGRRNLVPASRSAPSTRHALSGRPSLVRRCRSCRRRLRATGRWADASAGGLLRLAAGWQERKTYARLQACVKGALNQ